VPFNRWIEGHFHVKYHPVGQSELFQPPSLWQQSDFSPKIKLSKSSHHPFV
jgi:hypothetical protein